KADPQSKKLVMGFSMGGYNATQLLLRYPEKIKRAAILCPGIMSDRLFKLDSKQALQRFINKTENYASFADTDRLWDALKNFRDVFPTHAIWNAQASPVGAYARKRLGSQTPPLLLFSTRRDPFLIFEGVRQFADIAKDKMKDRLLWLPRKGLTHCFPFPVRPTARFLAGEDLSKIDTSFSDEPSGTGKQQKNTTVKDTPCCDK
ncbi:MAG: alpha/beta hydrolase, partial [Deltaproteobacteria bacterium]|nr:alpha/beta hydrolase [Deltaproteobacteria bacterium]